MAIKIPRKSGEPREGEVCIIRAPDGTLIPHQKIRFYTDDPPLETGRKMTDGEKDVADGIVPYMASQFGEYMRRVRAEEKRRKGK